MQTDELKTFEKMSEGIILFNEDGSFDYINEAGVDWLWGLRDDDGLYNVIAGTVNKVICGRSSWLGFAHDIYK